MTLAEAEEARAALRDQWHGDPTDGERLEILARAAELEQKLAALAERCHELER